jgi:hypothetical protein
VFQITSPAYNGDYEVEFNYADYVFPGSTASAPCAETSATLTWLGKSYSFTGAGGATLCGTNSSNDFLFASNGALLGYFNAPSDFSTPVLVNSLPPGWSGPSVPEPTALVLLALAGLPLLYASRRRLRSWRS